MRDLFHLWRLIVDKRTQGSFRNGNLFGAHQPGAIANFHAIVAGLQGEARLERLLAAVRSDASTDELADTAGMDTSTARKKLGKLRE